MKYFDRQFLRAEDFTAEQNYNIQRRRLHNRLMHTSGIAGEDQLSINHSIGENKLSVRPGTALDDKGQEIVVVDEGKSLILNADAGISEEGIYALYVEYDEEFTAKSKDPGASDFTRVQETPRFKFQKLTGSPPFNYPPLTLASVDVDKDGRLKTAPDTSMRKMVGTKMGFTGAFDALTAKSLNLREPGAIISPMWQVRLSLSERSQGRVGGRGPLRHAEGIRNSGGICNDVCDRFRPAETSRQR